MASIRSSISLHDRMTPVFKSIVRSMDSTMRVMQNLDKQANKGVQSKAYAQAEANIKRANNEIIKMQNNLDRADKATNRLADSTRRVGTSAAGWKSAGFNLVNLSAALYLLKGISSVMSSIMQAPDLARSTQARLGLFNESQYTDKQLYQGVYATALKTRTGLEETANLATRILISGAMTGEGAALGAIKTTGIINRALVAGGGTADENRRSLLQLSQGLASGTLQGDELRAIREQTPYMARMLAEGLGKIDPKFAGTTIGDLKRLGGEGELTAERIIKSFLAMEDEIDSAFAKMPRTFGQSMTQMGSVWKYFLTMLSEGDGALAKINAKAWQFSDFLTSDAGAKFLSKMAVGITILVDSMLKFFDILGASILWLSNNTDVLYASFVALGAVAVTTGIAAGAAWLAATWPILLVLAIIGLIVYAALQLGATMQEVTGSIAGGFMFVVYTIWDGFMFLLSGVYILIAVIANMLIGMGAGLILFFQGVVQLILWVVGTFMNNLMQILLESYTAWEGIITVVMSLFLMLYACFVGVGVGILGIIFLIASAIDKVFGSNLASSVEGWMNGLGSSLDVLAKKLDPISSMGKIKDAWSNAPWADFKGQDSDFNLFPKMKGTIEGADKLLMDPLWSTYQLIDRGLILDPTLGFDKGYESGYNFIDRLDKLDFSMGNDEISRMLDEISKFDPNSVTMNGGNLDTIGKIKSDVNIADEDIQLLRDISARDFLLNMQSITPQAHIKFGDVRETADVGKIIQVIEDMVDEAMATSLVTD